MKLQVYFQSFYHIEIGAYTAQLRHPDILSRLRAEVDASICQDASIASPDQAKFPYLNMVLKETLRYHSTGFGTFRTCPVDTEVSGVVLPANTTLALWNPAGQQNFSFEQPAIKLIPLYMS